MKPGAHDPILVCMPILIGSYNYADVKSKQFDIDQFQIGRLKSRKN